MLLALAWLLPAFRLNQLENVLCLGLLALATNLLVGHTGLITFGQAAFYAVGAYALAIATTQYALPFWVAVLAGPVLGAALAVAIGLLALRTKQLYFALLTLAFSELVYTIIEKWYSFTQGDNGIVGQMVPARLAIPINNYEFVLVIVTAATVLMWALLRSPLGVSLRCIRENSARSESLGIPVFRHQLIAFTIAGFFSGLAGTLFAVANQSAFPQLAEWTQSGDAVVACVIGGMFSFLGPVLGAFVLQYGHDFAVQYTSDWQLVLGLILVVIVLLAPDGLIGLARRAWARRGRPQPLPALAADSDRAVAGS